MPAPVRDTVETGTLLLPKRELKGFDEVPHYRDLKDICFFSGWIVGAAAFLLAFFALRHQEGTGAMRLLIVAANAAASLCIGVAVSRFCLGFYDRRRKLLDERMLGRKEDTDLYVGVAYTPGDWRYRGDTCWDRGYLRVARGQLTFHGLAQWFELPAADIAAVRLRFAAKLFCRRIPKVYIYWTAPDGTENALNIELLDPLDRKTKLEGARYLHKLVADLPRTSVVVDRGGLPFSSVGLGFASAELLKFDRRFALAVALASSVLLVLFSVLLDRILHSGIAFVGAAVGLFPQMYFTIMYSRVQDRATKNAPLAHGPPSPELRRMERAEPTPLVAENKP